MMEEGVDKRTSNEKKAKEAKSHMNLDWSRGVSAVDILLLSLSRRGATLIHDARNALPAKCPNSLLVPSPITSYYVSKQG